MNQLDIITDNCHFLLQNYPDAKQFREYLKARLSDESVKSFKIGYFPDANHIDILLREVDEETLLKLELLKKFNVTDSLCPRQVTKPFFEDHPIIIPYRDAYGNVVGFIGRTLLSEEDRKSRNLIKYKNTDFKKGNHLFGLYESKQAILDCDCVYIVEGQFDVIKAHEIGFKNVVALGNSQMTPYQFALICRYTKNINLLLDNDHAGEKGRKFIKQKFSTLARIKDFWIPEPYKDLDECITQNPVMPVFRIKK